MKKLLQVSVLLTFILPTVSFSRVIQCIDEKGNIHFTDTSCPKHHADEKPALVQHGTSSLTANRNQQTVRSWEFYCNPRKGKFIRCGK